MVSATYFREWLSKVLQENNAELWTKINGGFFNFLRVNLSKYHDRFLRLDENKETLPVKIDCAVSLHVTEI